jgi:hypothetical protein
MAATTIGLTFPEQEEKTEKDENVTGDGLGEMDVEQLKAYAAEHNIDLGQATSLDGILKKIRAALKA